MSQIHQTAPDRLVLTGGTLLTMDRDASVVRANLTLAGGRIESIGERGSEAADPAHPAATSARTLDVTDCLVMPGLIQAHVHLGQTLFRGLAEGRRLLDWLRERIWPLEAAHDDESAYWSGLLGAAECLLSGTTTIQDIGLGPGSRGLQDAIRDAGLRGFAGPCLMDETGALAPGLGSSAEQEIRLAEELGRELERIEGARLRPSINPRFILSCSDSLWQEVRALAARTGWPVHTHALEQVEEGAAIRQLKGCDEIEYFDHHGLLDRDLRIAHGVQLQKQHLDRVGNLIVHGHGTFSVAHCPGSNLKLGSGIADVMAIRAAGIPVGIGADGAPCNNDLDAFEEIRLAALLQKLEHGPDAFSGLDALRLATSEGAVALGLGEETGSLEAGRAADIVVLSTDRPELWSPGWAARQKTAELGASLADQVVFAASRASVRHVIVGGELLVEDGRLTRLDPLEIRSRAEIQLDRLLARAQVRP